MSMPEEQSFDTHQSVPDMAPIIPLSDRSAKEEFVTYLAGELSHSTEEHPVSDHSARVIALERLIKSFLDRPTTHTLDLIEAMKNINGELPENMKWLVPFGVIYLATTENVHAAIENNSIGSHDTLHTATGRFAHKWFMPVLKYAGTQAEKAGNQELADYATEIVGEDYEIPEPWRVLLEEFESREAEEGIQFLMGMTSHVDYDLAILLYEMKAGKSYKADYFKVDDIIRLTAQQQAEKYIPVKNEKLRRTMAHLACSGIIRMRKRAWKDGQRLQKYDEKYDEDTAAEKRQKLMAKRERQAARKVRRVRTLGGKALSAAMSVDNKIESYRQRAAT